MIVLPQISRSYLQAWLKWDSMHAIARIENRYRGNMPDTGRLLEMIRAYESGVHRRIVMKMLDNHVRYGPQPIMLLSEAEAKSLTVSTPTE